MRITVLGKSPAWQDADGACSGYLLEDADTRLLVDCGSSVFAKLRRFADYVDVDAVLITHMHADHFLDLFPFACALSYAPRQQPAPVAGWPGTDAPARPRLLLPGGGAETLQIVARAAGHQATLMEHAFDLHEYDVAEPLTVGDLGIRFQPVPHYVPANAVEVRGSGGGRFTFGADCGPTEALDGFAMATDLLILEATLTEPESDGVRGHLTPAEAGELAARCDAGRLVLSHISDELDADWACAEARHAYGGPVEVAREGAVYEV